MPACIPQHKSSQRFYAPAQIRAPQPRWLQQQQSMARPYGGAGLGMVETMGMGQSMGGMMPGMVMPRGGPRPNMGRMIQHQQRGVGMGQHQAGLDSREAQETIC